MAKPYLPCIFDGIAVYNGLFSSTARLTSPNTRHWQASLSKASACMAFKKSASASVGVKGFLRQL
jgi:hypothetical protein